MLALIQGQVAADAGFQDVNVANYLNLLRPAVARRARATLDRDGAVNLDAALGEIRVRGQVTDLHAATPGVIFGLSEPAAVAALQKN